MTETLTDLVRAELEAPVPPSVAAFAARLAQRHPGSAAILFYGSCLRSGLFHEQMLDFYLLVDRYDRAYASRWLGLANRLLPPNVFYAQETVGSDVLRCKYAVLSVEHFARLASSDTFNPAVWARFAQPSVLAWVRDEAARMATLTAVARAAPRLLSAVRGMMPAVFAPEALWTLAFAQTYRTELRAERDGRNADIVASDAARYARFTGPALAEAGIAVRALEEGQLALLAPPSRLDGFLARLAWLLRRLQGKTLTVLRLAKAASTFDGGLDYLAWKIERHARVPVRPTAWDRAHPRLAGLLWLIRLRRIGAVR